MNISTYILAGGVGERLSPLTLYRSKPSVPFGGIYRLIDFTLTNCIRSGLSRIYLLTQYRSESLQRHINAGWSFVNALPEGSILALPPQMRFGNQWYEGTADALFQNLYALQRDKPDHVLILSGDHIYRMDYQKLAAFHEERGAEISIVTFPVPLDEARRFGVVGISDDERILSFLEKPDTPPPIPAHPEMALVNMGVYLMNTGTLAKVVSDDSRNTRSSHDFGKDIFPRILDDFKVYAFPFPEGCPDTTPFWMDVGTVDSYYDVSLSLLKEEGEGFHLCNPQWPIHTTFPNLNPARVQGATVENALLSPGCHVEGCVIRKSILGPGVRVRPGAVVEESVLFDGVDVGRNARISRAILDKMSIIPEGMVLGDDEAHDRTFAYLTPGGVRVIKRGVDLTNI